MEEFKRLEEQKFYSFKGKLYAVNTFSSILMIIAGSYGLICKAKSNSPSFVYYLIILLIGFIFFAITLKHFFTKKSGIYLTPKKLILRSGFVLHSIEWKEIKGFQLFEKMNQYWIAVELIDNNKFLVHKNILARKMGRFNEKRFGTPIAIAANYYDVSRFELMSELNYYLEKYS